MDKIIELKAEIFDIQVQLEQLVNLKNQKLQQLQVIDQEKERREKLPKPNENIDSISNPV